MLVAPSWIPVPSGYVINDVKVPLSVETKGPPSGGTPSPSKEGNLRPPSGGQKSISVP